MASKRWQDGVNALLGLYLFASLSNLGFTTPASAATRGPWILSLAIAVLAAIAANWPRTRDEVFHLFLGICVLASPLALIYLDQAKATLKVAAVALLVTTLVIWAMLKSRGGGTSFTR